MSEVIQISKKNESYINIDCELGILYELAEHFVFTVEGAKFHPKVKMNLWDGKIRLLDVRFGTLPAGLSHELVRLATKLGYDVQVKDSKQYGNITDTESLTFEEFTDWVSSLNISSNGESLTPRDYQIETAFHCIKQQRRLALSPTGSGKSLIIYIIFRWFFDNFDKSCLIIVPNLSLIKQMKNDFIDYSELNEFDVDSLFQTIEGGMSKTITHPLILSTWQSIYKQPSQWFNKFDVIIVDECHLAKAESIRGIFEKSTDVKYRYGFTGSLDGSKTNKMVLRGMIGEILKIKTTRDLIEEGHLSDVKITCILLKYGKESSSMVKSMNYQQEVEFLCDHERRNNFIVNLALQLKGNTLILFNYVEKHGEPLYEKIKAKAKNKSVHFVAGKVEADDRERIRHLIQHEKGDSITVASVGTMSTGTNIPRIHNIIFATPTKSVVRVMQSLGRGLRKSEDKDHLNLFDIADNIVKSKAKPNHTMRHFVERLKIYVDEQHNYKIVEVEIE